jgi:DeoR family transcriptional regulator, suf operon transcriptional repressor
MKSSPDTKTRKLLLQLLRSGPATVEDLAAELELTPNAVRFHVASLEADGSIEAVGRRSPPGAGKPAVVYAISAQGDLGFSNAYAPVLAACVKELRSSVPASEVVPFLRRVGRRLASNTGSTKGPLARRVRRGADLLNELGGLTTVTRTSSGFLIDGRGCPLGAVVSTEPCVCAAVESLLRNVVGAQVTQCCDHGPRPSCRFEIREAKSA